MTTILRARIAHTPRDPFLDSSALETYDDGAVAFDDGTILATGPYAEVSKAHPDAEVARPPRLLPLPRPRRHPRPLSADRRDRRDGPAAARLARHPDAAGGGEDGRPGARAQDRPALRQSPRRQRHDLRARLRLALPGRAAGAVRGGRRARSADRQRPRGLQPQPAARARGHAAAGLRHQPRAARALARRRPAALRGHAALQRVLRRGDARRLPRPPGREPDRRCSRATSTRARARSSSCASCSRRRATTSAPTRTPGCSASARCWPTTSTSPTTSSTVWPPPRPRSRTARRATRSSPPGSLRWRSTSSTACASAWARTSAPAPA